MACSISKCVFLMILCCVVLRQYSSVSAGEDEAAENTVPLAKGLSWTFYQKSCPEAESIIRNQLKKILDWSLTSRADWDDKVKPMSGDVSQKDGVDQRFKTREPLPTIFEVVRK